MESILCVFNFKNCRSAQTKFAPLGCLFSRLRFLRDASHSIKLHQTNLGPLDVSRRKNLFALVKQVTNNYA